MSGPATMTLEEVCAALRMSRTTAKRRMKAGRFPIPYLPRVGQERFRFSAERVQRYIDRAEHGVVLSMRRRSA